MNMLLEQTEVHHPEDGGSIYNPIWCNSPKDYNLSNMFSKTRRRITVFQLSPVDVASLHA